jgi:hypothetical protein
MVNYGPNMVGLVATVIWKDSFEGFGPLWR